MPTIRPTPYLNLDLFCLLTSFLLDEFFHVIDLGWRGGRKREEAEEHQVRLVASASNKPYKTRVELSHTDVYIHYTYRRGIILWIIGNRSTMLYYLCWHHVGILLEAAGSSIYFQVQYLQLNLYSKFGSEQPPSSVPHFVLYSKILA